MVKRMRLVAFDGVMAGALEGPGGILPKGGCRGKRAKCSGVLTFSQPARTEITAQNRVRVNFKEANHRAAWRFAAWQTERRPMVHAVVPIDRWRCSRKTHRGSLESLHCCFSARRARRRSACGVNCTSRCTIRKGPRSHLPANL